MVKSKLIAGVGINDADYVVEKKEVVGYTEQGKAIRKTVWLCPFYLKWRNMIRRCYNEKVLIRQPSYVGCFVSKEWHSFMTFRSWMEKQDWKGKQLDKDILFPGNKIYSEGTCVFVDQKVNNFLVDSAAIRGEWPMGVNFDKCSGKFKAQAWDADSGKTKYLGLYESPEQAHNAWLTEKILQAIVIAGEQQDQRVAEAILSKYLNYKE